MRIKNHLMYPTNILLILTLLFIGSTLLCSCGEGDKEAPDPTIKILWNQTENKYLFPKEVIQAPSGELRVKESGEYLVREKWQEKEVLKSELAKLRHHET
jgi:hypothetical protein